MSGQRKSGNSDRGNVLNVKKDDSDDDSLGFEQDQMAEMIQDVQKANKAKKTVVISVSHGFVNVGTSERVYLVPCPRLGMCSI